MILSVKGLTWGYEKRIAEILTLFYTGVFRINDGSADFGGLGNHLRQRNHCGDMEAWASFRICGVEMQCCGQASAQAPHRVHLSCAITATLSSTLIAFVGQTFSQRLQPMQPTVQF